MNYEAIPVVRIEVERMRHAIMTAFNLEQMKLDEHFQIALDAACSDKNIQFVLEREIRSHIEIALKASVDDYFTRGLGKKTLREMIDKRLDKLLPKDKGLKPE